MGRPVTDDKAESMYLVLCCWLVYVTISPNSVAAAELDIYPELPDEVIVKRIQHVLTEFRQRQLRILQDSRDHEVLPQFTYQLPEAPNRNYQSDLFAVPPSDPRYYQPDTELQEDKRTDDDPEIQQENLMRTQGEQLGAPLTTGEESWSDDSTTTEPNQSSVAGEDVLKRFLSRDDKDILLIAIIAGCGAAAAAGVVALAVGWYRLHNNSKAAADIEYPAYGVTGPNKEITPTGDRRLAQSAQMYHYQHQKQQIIAMESNRANNERRGSISEGDSDEENEEGDYTVYECPGLAATGELEVKNPLFQDDPTPAAGNHTIPEPPVPTDKKQ
uniref:Neural proliferation differentiation and control protein 1 n=1 Tax=Cuerna arida TaxID=1464854 RepID=A0A1B6FLZ7_9HEMI